MDYEYNPDDESLEYKRRMSINEEMREEKLSQERMNEPVYSDQYLDQNGEMVNTVPGSDVVQHAENADDGDEFDEYDEESEKEPSVETIEFKTDYGGRKRGPKQYRTAKGARTIDNEERLGFWARQAAEEDSIIPAHRSRGRQRKNKVNELNERDLNRMYRSIIKGTSENDIEAKDGKSILDDMTVEQLGYVYDKLAARQDYDAESVDPELLEMMMEMPHPKKSNIAPPVALDPEIMPHRRRPISRVIKKKDMQPPSRSKRNVSRHSKSR